MDCKSWGISKWAVSNQYDLNEVKYQSQGRFPYKDVTVIANNNFRKFCDNNVFISIPCTRKNKSIPLKTQWEKVTVINSKSKISSNVSSSS